MDKCPICGAAVKEQADGYVHIVFKCGSVVLGDLDEITVSQECRIAEQAAQIAHLQAIVDRMREAAKENNESISKQTD